jgi:hypothetical protein
MRCYCIRANGDRQADTYWVAAESRLEARRIVTLNCEAAREADQLEIFECESSSKRTPPPWLIYSRLGGPIPIEEFYF